MKIIVISSVSVLASETVVVNQLFREGLELFHLRKPGFSTKLLEEYIGQIYPQYRNRIVLHSKHKLALQFNLNRIHLTKKHKKRKLRTWLWIRYLSSRIPDLKISASFHSINSIELDSSAYEYVFLSPVFDSVSKSNYKGKYNSENMPGLLGNIKQDVVALGGVDSDKIDRVYDLKYAGIAVHGAIWKSNNPIEKFKEILKACEQKNTPLA